MRVVDEYVALRVLNGDWPTELPEDVLGLPWTRHWRLLSSLALPGSGRISRRLNEMSEAGRQAIRQPHPDLLKVLDDPRATAHLAADLLALTGPTSMLIIEALAVAIRHTSPLYVGDSQNAVGAMATHAASLHVEIVVADRRA